MIEDVWSRTAARGLRLQDVDRELVKDGSLGRIPVPVADVRVGPWRPPDIAIDALTVVVVEGLLLWDRDDGLCLFGPGDYLDPRGLAVGSWDARTPARLAILHRGLRLPPALATQLTAAVVRRVFDTLQDRHDLIKVLARPRVEDRIVGYLQQTAARWGTQTPAESMVRLPVTHVVLGRLIGAKRSTVSLGVAALERDGRLLREPGGIWRVVGRA